MIKYKTNCPDCHGAGFFECWDEGVWETCECYCGEEETDAENAKIESEHMVFKTFKVTIEEL